MDIKQRKLMSNVVQFLDKLEKDCLLNQQAVITLAKTVQPFAEVEWYSPRWNVTEAVQHKIRGHESRKTKFLNFFRNIPNNSTPLDGQFGDIVKAMTILRFHRGGQSAPNQQRFIDGWRYIYDALEMHQHRIEIITVEVLNNACKQASLRLGAGSAYNVHKSVHEIADLLDRNKLTKVHLGFRYSGAKRPENTSGVGYMRLDNPESQVTSNSKMVSEAVLEALGILYQKIPKDALADRVRILLVTLALFLGRRIGEILTMPAVPVQRNQNNTAFVTIHPQKWAQGDLTVTKQLVPLPSACIELIESVIDELLEITEPVRDVAQYIHKHQHADYRVLEPYQSVGWMSSADIEQCFGTSGRNGNQWAKLRKLVAQPRPGHINPRTICWDVDQIKLGMNQDIDLMPILITNEGKLFPKDCIAILPLNACHSVKSTFHYAVRLVDWQQISDFLGSNSSRRNGKEKNPNLVKVLSVFDKYLVGSEKERLGVNSHAFRHTLNTWIDEGGMSDAAQSRWFGRKNPRDTKAYQHTSPAKAALQVRRDLLDGAISGPVATQIKYLPIDAREAFVKGRIRAVHDVGPGLCFHDFSQMPCERSLQCSAECDDYHWRNDDKGRIDDVKRQYAITWQARKTAEEKAFEGRGKSNDWLVHNDKKLSVHLRQLKDMGISEFDPEHYIKERGL